MKQFLKILLTFLAWLLGLFRVRTRPVHPARIFLLASGYLGDTFWAVQVIRIIREAYPDAELYIGGRPFIRELCRNVIPEDHQYLIRSAISDRMREKVSFRKIFSEGRFIRETVHPDLVFDLVCNRYSALFSFFTGAYSVGLDIADEFFPLYSFCAGHDRIPGVHLAFRPRAIVRQYLHLPDSPEIELLPPIPSCSRQEIFSRIGAKEKESILMIIPGAGWAAKQWSAENFHAVAELFAGDYDHIVISGTENERELCDQVGRGIPGAVILCSRLAETISLLPYCKAVIGNDSGVIHLAASFGGYVFSLFCQTNPEFCGAIGKRSYFFRARCPYSPQNGEHFCFGKPSLICRREERMRLSPSYIARKIRERMQGTAEKDKELISVILSVYNEEKYLEECLYSIAGQTYGNLEVLMIDDGSADRTPEICRRYASSDPRFRYIRFDDRKGQGARRNHGISIAKGKYVSFIDGDDAAHPEMLSVLHGMMERENARVAVCRLQTSPGFCSGRIREKIRVMDGKEATRRFLTDPGFGAFSCNKLFLADFLRSSGRYPEGMFYEDIVLIPQLCAGADRIAETDRVLYFYRQHKESVTRSDFTPAKMDQVKAYDFLLPVLLKKYPELEQLIYEKALFAMMGLFNILIVDGFDSPEYRDILLRKAKEFRNHISPLYAANRMRCLIFSAAILFPRWYQIALKLCYRR